MISLTNYDSSEGEQWGRYNLPRDMYTLQLRNPWQSPCFDDCLNDCPHLVHGRDDSPEPLHCPHTETWCSISTLCVIHIVIRCKHSNPVPKDRKGWINPTISSCFVQVEFIGIHRISIFWCSFSWRPSAIIAHHQPMAQVTGRAAAPRRVWICEGPNSLSRNQSCFKALANKMMLQDGTLDGGLWKAK